MNATRICSIDGCGGRVVSRGLCRNHYEWHRKHGLHEQFPLDVRVRHDNSIGTVYALIGPDGAPFYVGATRNPLKTRLRQHKHRAEQGHASPVYVRIREVGSESVTIEALEAGIPREVLLDREAAWIARLRQQHVLTNERALDGVPDSMSARTRALIGAAKSGRPTWISGKHGEDAGWDAHRREAMARFYAEKRANRVPHHGTANEYSGHGCRCDACRAAYSTTRRGWGKPRTD